MTPSKALVRDIALVLVSIAVAVLLVHTGALTALLTHTTETAVVGSFVAGFFFASMFTTAPAIVTLGQLAQHNSVVVVALAGGVGAAVADLIIFRLVRDHLQRHLESWVRQGRQGRRITALLKLRTFRYLTLVLAGMVVASPLPDELGIELVELSRVQGKWLVPLSVVFNGVGIAIIGLVARTL